MALGNSVQYAGEYALEECKLLSSTGVVARLEDAVIEFNIFENMFTSSLMLSLMIVDKENLIMNMPIVGQEFVSFKVTTKGVGSFDFTENVFSVHKVSARQDASAGAQIYELSCISTEALRNNRTRVSKSFSGTNSEIIESILRDTNLISTNKQITMDETSRLRKYVAPNTRPIDFIRTITRESFSKKFGGSPHYFFFENTKGFQFRVLDSLYKEPFQGEFVASEAMKIDGENKRGNLENDYRRILNFTLSHSNDTLMSSRMGMLGSNLIKYNIFHKNYTEHTFNYFDNFKNFGRIDQNPIYNQVTIDEKQNTLGDFPNAKIQVHPSSNDGTHDTMYYDTDTGYNFSDNNAENWLSTRRSKMVELRNGGLSIQLKTRGYCKLSAGDKIHLTLPITGKDHGKSKIDTFYEGEFLVTQLRHNFDQSERKHTMLMSAVKDAIPTEFNNVAKSTEPKGSKGQTFLQ
tara:strand:+ start:628 stop:2013 length:1386 start_codon:yes stop_codon:yes gene_type:complete